MRISRQITFDFAFMPSVNIRLSFFVFAAAAAGAGCLRLFAVCFLFVTLHELCHIFSAAACGAETSAVTVYPIGECAVIDGFEDIHIFKRILVLLSGPVFNIVVGAVFFGSVIGKINIVLGIFNLLPIYPLDGGKILHYTAAYFTGTLRSGRYMTYIGCTASVIIMAAGIVQLVLCGFNISLFAVGLYMYRFNRFKYMNVTYSFYRTLIRKQKRRILPVRTVAVSGKISAKTIIYRLGWDYYLNIVIRSGNDVCMGISEEYFIKYILKNGLNCTAENIFLEKSRQMCKNI